MDSTATTSRPLRLVEEVPTEAEPDWSGLESLDQFLSAIGRYPRLMAAQEVELAIRIERGDAEARARMIESNLRVVALVAKSHRGCGVPCLELIRAGLGGLNRAVDGFDWRLGNRFPTYAGWWIERAIRAEVRSRAGESAAA